ncbi:MAG: SMP-30/gluconolactonase/LRE family protein [Lentisphaeria bacterium]|nr:SMP-30/gluconolactonase/LRE family protein [Lentisphaeria bacterium]
MKPVRRRRPGRTASHKPRGGRPRAGWGGVIRRFDPSGKLAAEIRLPGIIVSSLCFGGTDWRDMYITTANYPYDRREFFRKHAGCVLVWKNSPYQGLKIPFFGENK